MTDLLTTMVPATVNDAMTAMTATQRPLQVGDRVLVHQGSLRIANGIEEIFGDCSQHSHWQSRILSPSRTYEGHWDIATSARSNANYAEWTYGADRLTLIDDGSDWTSNSQFSVGMKVVALNPMWDDPEKRLKFENGRKFCEATILTPHIEPGDWYLMFDAVGSEVFRKVVNEAAMLPKLPAMPAGDRSHWIGRMRALQLASNGVIATGETWCRVRRKVVVSILCACGSSGECLLDRDDKQHGRCADCGCQYEVETQATLMHGHRVKVNTTNNQLLPGLLAVVGPGL